MLVRREYNPYGSVEIPALFKTSTVADIYLYVYDRYGSDEVVKSGNFCLMWRGQQLDSNMEIGNINVDGEKIKLYVPDMQNPIMIRIMRCTQCILPPSSAQL